ncbi:hypothetical protein M427DRAFT_32850 [Gonapodya prolifera JEL478]|uniref:ER-bound oxygenase mpaB/mpaB'/Rubber oxygenase catalytic domain-containing protein n=1 Tax=Gonapodya prolifera (strain JEL478) TaxID=1344416 RepID=A0A139AEP6_GONPJ|nr:hypothetical protein M427DRAFT_32850 [Gonapodya prolifera JEL478]|eukprot:KXS14893.1 hypothetical protein M427DRAFT_32850 [Gonapodya prolifera JEL478]
MVGFSPADLPTPEQKASSSSACVDPINPEALSGVLAELFQSGGGTDMFNKYPRTPVAELEKLRHKCDDLIDNYLNSGAEIDVRKDDVIAKLKEHALGGNQAAVVLWTHLNDIPSWIDWQRLKRGQRLFWFYAEPMLLFLLHFSLIFGVTAPKINKVLMATGYLSHPTKVTFQRLIETTHWVLSCMNENSLLPGRPGWENSVRVRFLHASVRQRIRGLAKSKPHIYNEEELGIPINTEDMIATILGFSLGPLQRLMALKFRVSEKEREDFCHLWRYIGYLSGIPDDLNPLRRGYDYCTAFGGSVTLHICEPDESTIRLAHGLLQASSLGSAELTFQIIDVIGLVLGTKTELGAKKDINPKSLEKRRKRFYGYFSQVTRITLKDKYCDYLGLPKKEIGLLEWGAAHSTFLGLLMATQTLKLTKPTMKWFAKRNENILPRVVNAVLQGKPPKFQLRHAPKASNMVSGGAAAGGGHSEE